MPTSFGGRIALDGEKEFKQAISEINAGLKLNQSAMALVAQQYSHSADSAAAYRAKIDALTGAIEAQREKVDTLRQIVAKSAETNGESSKKTTEWKTSLNNAEKELSKMEGQLGDYKTALQKTEDSTDKTRKVTDSLAEGIRSMASYAGVNLPPALDGMISKLDGVSASGAAAATVLAAIMYQLGKSTIETAQMADDLTVLSQQTGMSTDDLQKFNYASELIDVSTETLHGSLTKLKRSMGDAAEGSGASAKAFQTLGIKVKDSGGHLRSSNEVFYEAIDALGRVKNETERDALAMDIFGKSATDLNPLIDAGSGKLRELGEEAEKTGNVLGTGTLDKFNQLKDAMDRFQQAGNGVKAQLAQALLPALTALFETLGKIPVGAWEAIITLASLVASFVLMYKATEKAMNGIDKIGQFMEGMDPKAIRTAAIIMGVVAALVALAAIIAVIMGKSGQLESSMNSIGGSVSRMQSSVSSAQSSYNRVPGYAKGTSFHPGGLAVVGEDGPELVQLPRGSRVYPNGSAGGDTYQITLNVDADRIRQVQDIIDICGREAMSIKQGVAKT